jgi:CheY-like chemotaxis protein
MSHASNGSQQTEAGDKVRASLPWPRRQSQLSDALSRVANQDQDRVEPLARAKRNSLPAAPSASAREQAPLVLVVDDVDVNRRIAVLILNRLGYRTQTAASGLAALDILTRTVCAAVLMDCHMPDMDGLAATAEIRRREGDIRHTPIIAMTADAQNRNRELCLSQGMDDFISKPVMLNLLARVLARWAALPTTHAHVPF